MGCAYVRAFLSCYIIINSHSHTKEERKEIREIRYLTLLLIIIIGMNYEEIHSEKICYQKKIASIVACVWIWLVFQTISAIWFSIDLDHCESKHLHINRYMLIFLWVFLIYHRVIIINIIGRCWRHSLLRHIRAYTCVYSCNRNEDISNAHSFRREEKNDLARMKQVFLLLFGCCNASANISIRWNIYINIHYIQ